MTGARRKHRGAFHGQGQFGSRDGTCRHRIAWRPAVRLRHGRDIGRSQRHRSQFHHAAEFAGSSARQPVGLGNLLRAFRPQGRLAGVRRPVPARIHRIGRAGIRSRADRRHGARCADAVHPLSHPGRHRRRRRIDAVAALHRRDRAPGGSRPPRYAAADRHRARHHHRLFRQLGDRAPGRRGLGPCHGLALDAGLGSDPGDAFLPAHAARARYATLVRIARPKGQGAGGAAPDHRRSDRAGHAQGHPEHPGGKDTPAVQLRRSGALRRHHAVGVPAVHRHQCRAVLRPFDVQERGLRHRFVAGADHRYWTAIRP